MTAKKISKEYPVKKPTVPQVTPLEKMTIPELRQREENIAEFHRLQMAEGKTRHKQKEGE